MKPWAEPALSDDRIITPALAHAAVFCTLATRATIVTSPSTGWYTKWNASAVPHTSAPAPATVNVEFAKVALPDAPTAPTSTSTHGLGTGSPPPLGVPAVVKLQTGPSAVTPAIVFDTIFQ